jgi:hypothetical protein
MSCFFPQRYNASNPNQLLPCNSCPKCKSRRVSEWVTKLLFEAKSCNNNVYFVTLTYSDAHLPDAHKFSGGSLKKDHLQKFIKRFRWHFERLYKRQSPIRYFGVGEYGSKTHRAHYHILLFGLDPMLHNVDHLVNVSWKYSEISSDVQLIGQKNLLKNTVTMFDGSKYSDNSLSSDLVKSMRYTLKYVLKQKGDLTGLNREPEFSLKSTVPTLGYNFLAKYVAPYFRQNNIYPFLGLSGFNRFLFEELYINHPSASHFDKPYIFSGAYLLTSDGGLDFKLTDFKMDMLVKKQKASLLKMDRRMQEKLLDLAYPDLMPSLDAYLRDLSKSDYDKLLVKYKLWLRSNDLRADSDRMDYIKKPRDPKISNDSQIVHDKKRHLKSERLAKSNTKAML